MFIVETILDVAKQLFGLRAQLGQEKREQRDRISEYLDRIASTLSEVATELRLGNVPHGKCAEMGGHADLLEQTIGNGVDAKQLGALAADLKAAHKVEEIFVELDQVKDSQKEIAKIDEAAGIFRAVAASVKAAG